MADQTRCRYTNWGPCIDPLTCLCNEFTNAPPLSAITGQPAFERVNPPKPTQLPKK